MLDRLPLASPPVRRKASSVKWDTSPLSRPRSVNRCCRYVSISALVIVILGACVSLVVQSPPEEFHDISLVPCRQGREGATGHDARLPRYSKARPANTRAALESIVRRPWPKTRTARWFAPHARFPLWTTPASLAGFPLFGYGRRTTVDGHQANLS